MEEQQELLPDLRIDDVARAYLKNTAGWARFIAVSCIVFLAFALFFLLFFAMFTDELVSALRSKPELAGYNTSLIIGAIWGGCIMAILYLAVYGFILLRFASGTGQGTTYRHQPSLENGIGSLKNYFVFAGVLTILGALFNLLMFFR